MPQHITVVQQLLQVSVGKLVLKSGSPCRKLVVGWKPCGVAEDPLGESTIIPRKFLLVVVHGLLVGVHWLLISGAFLRVEGSRVDVGSPHCYKYKVRIKF